MKGKTILVVDDDPNLCHLIETTFSLAGAKVYTANDGQEGIKAFYDHRPDLVILDILMPGIDGWEVCRQIRLVSNVPIIMLTTLNKDEEIIKGLDYGADHFVTKPFSTQVLLARARAALRRTQLASTPESRTVYQDDYLLIDLPKRQVFVRGESVRLTATEFDLLSYLFLNAGQVLTYQQILEQIWGWEYRDSVDYVHVYISHLRRKLEEDPRNPRYLLTEHGVGYRFQPQK
ncbi:MAG: DNA-binding response regulator [Chloroflexi bacterium]|nr:MAG: DNA-binding response regulator [Chloroflexota bacterium]